MNRYNAPRGQVRENCGKRKLRRQTKWMTRDSLAGAIFIAAVLIVAAGAAREYYLASHLNDWQARLVRGEPAIVQFICGTDTVLDCNVPVQISYQKQESKWCENIEQGDQSGVYATHWCNADPEQGTISLYGAVHSFDADGAVKRGGKLVGQLFELSQPKNGWEALLVRSEPVLVRFICTAETINDCGVWSKISYHRRDSLWCETVERADEGGPFKSGGCNGNPQLGTISIKDVVYFFDRSGALRKRGQLAGQLFVMSAVENDWQARFVRSQPVVIRFVCGTDTPVDCTAPIRIFYRKQDGVWCEHLHVGDATGEYPSQWCNANPELGEFSLFGARFSFDRAGAVRRAGHLVGQLFIP
jgi:hypothetical protein